LNLNDLKQILELVREHALSEFEVEENGLRLRIRKEPSGVVLPQSPAVPAGAASAPLAVTAAPSGPAAVSDQEEIELAVVKSPIVGTFFTSPEPGAAPFVEVGAIVKKGQVLCIIEAMKLMNEIDSEYDGEVVNIYVENGQPVQYGERLFAIRTR